MNIRQTCEYCGNTSGKVDSFGGCISCGAQLRPIVPYRHDYTEYLYDGISGSVPRKIITLSENEILSPQEMRDLVRRRLGL